MKRALWRSLLALLVFLCFAQSSAFAYLDPGSGSYLFQILLAFFIGALFSLKVLWKKMAAFFSKLFSKKNGPSKP